jgi:hypothetical protein
MNFLINNMVSNYNLNYELKVNAPNVLYVFQDPNFFYDYWL